MTVRSACRQTVEAKPTADLTRTAAWMMIPKIPIVAAADARADSRPTHCCHPGLEKEIDMKIPRIVVVGSVNADMVVKSGRLPAPGETVIGGQFVMVPGGKGANQAVAARRLGAEVTLVAKVGQDPLGDEAIDNYRREGILTDLIGRDPTAATGVALILVDAAGENLISVASGANAALTPADVDRAAERIRAADAVLVQLEIPLETVCHTARLAADAGVCLILDPAPAAPLPSGLLAATTILTPNEHEAECLTGIVVSDESTARQAATQLLLAGARHVIITLGAKGAWLASADGQRLIATREVAAVDTTAAGDAFNGGLAWALGRGLPIEAAVAQACAVGALSATRLGAQPSLPTTDQLEHFLKAR
ncbi:MAG TPA: ribokinase [Pirellulales bacterium]|jgi:ribokinase|nr:ribokinase [Pirellulales bacterium]